MSRFNAVSPLAALLLVAATIATAASAQSDPVARGARLVELYCAGCHAVGASGRSNDAAAPPFRQLYQRYPDDGLDRAIEAGILTGHPMMPAFAFSAADIKAVINYLKAVQAQQAA